MYESFNLIHPDGIGVYFASKYLYATDGMNKRFAGSDFYNSLISNSISEGRSFFFFGHTLKELDKIKTNYPALSIAGIQEGYNFNTDEVIKKINKADPDILIIGLSCPIQEKWMFENRDKIKFKIMLAVGDGIRVFSGDKIRGPKILQIAGLEWLIRVFTDPRNNFNRYVKGIPIFIQRIIRFKQTLIK
ncbi:MAG: WecB/TagA/CpsF family glycosyltransferase [Ignavibacteria bacterium]